MCLAESKNGKVGKQRCDRVNLHRRTNIPIAHKCFAFSKIQLSQLFSVSLKINGDEQNFCVDEISHRENAPHSGAVRCIIVAVAVMCIQLAFR